MIVDNNVGFCLLMVYRWQKSLYINNESCIECSVLKAVLVS